MLRAAVRTAGALLLLFHAWLLARAVWAGDLVEPGVLARWAVAAALLAALIVLRRQRVSLVRGRRAVSIWLLAALLHGPAMATRVELVDGPGLPEIVATLAQVALGPATLLALILLAGRLASSRPTSFVTRPHSHHALLGALAPGSHLAFAPRPPPLA